MADTRLIYPRFFWGQDQNCRQMCDVAETKKSNNDSLLQEIGYINDECPLFIREPIKTISLFSWKKSLSVGEEIVSEMTKKYDQSTKKHD